MSLSFPRPEPWMAQALCAQIGGDRWFPDKGERVTDAVAVCRDCPVTTACLRYALDNDERHGIWAGLTPEQRKHLRGRAAA